MMPSNCHLDSLEPGETEMTGAITSGDCSDGYTRNDLTSFLQFIILVASKYIYDLQEHVFNRDVLVNNSTQPGSPDPASPESDSMQICTGSGAADSDGVDTKNPSLLLLARLRQHLHCRVDQHEAESA